MAAKGGRSARLKGATAEREFFKLLNAELAGEEWEPFKRNLIQTRQGGADTEAHHSVSIEVKRRETLSIGTWLKQMREQTNDGQTPVLAYRQNKQPWTILVEMDVAAFIDYLVEMHGYERKPIRETSADSGPAGEAAGGNGDNGPGDDAGGSAGSDAAGHGSGPSGSGVRPEARH